MSTQLWPFPGARWWKFDFHSHTPASSDYGAGPNQPALKARSHREWLQDYLDAGIHCVAVTDHNCGDWIDPLKAELEAMREEGIPGANEFHLFPGVELTLNGAHFLALFDPSASTRTIQDLLAVARCNDADRNAEAYCSESVQKICEEVIDRGGLFIPAHVDLDQTGIFKLQANHSALDPILKLEGILAMEVCDPAYTPPACYTDAKLRWARVLGSDCHHPGPPAPEMGITEPRYPGSHFTWVKMATPTIDALRLALIDGEGVSIRRSDDTSPFDPFAVADDLIEEITVGDARYMGRGSAETLRFSPWLNALIGGRGSGKSTVVQLLRLALRRESEILKLPADSPARAEFERFRRTAQGRSGEGALTAETRIQVVYRHQGARYRLHWSATAGDETETIVEEWDETAGDWKRATSQEVRERFPVRMFSQGQIAALANEQSGALLRLVDEAIDHTGWKERWAAMERTFLSKRSEIRELQAKLQSKDRVVGQLEDVRRKLARFEAAEHAKVLKTYQTTRRQAKEHDQQSKEAREIGDRLVRLADEISASDVPEGVFDPADPLGSEGHASIERMRAAIAEAAQATLKAGEKLLATVVDEETSIGSSQWKAGVDAAKEAYDKLVVDLQAQGVQDPSEYGRLVQDRQRLEGEVKVLDSLAEKLETKEIDCEASRLQLQDLRRELSDLRAEFLVAALSSNNYVKIELLRYGRDPFVARDSLREVLGIDGNPGQFEADIFQRDEAGLETDRGTVAKLLADLPTENPEAELERRLNDLRNGLAGLATGGEFDQVSGYLKNRLRKNAEGRPEFVDRSLFVHAAPGGYFHRVGSSKRPMSPEYLARLFQQRSQARIIRFDEQVVPNSKVEDLDIGLVDRFRTNRTGGDRIQLLSNLAMVREDEDGTMRPTVSGILMGTKKPSEWLSSAYIQAVAYAGTTVVPQSGTGAYQLDAKDIAGPLDSQVLEACRFVFKNMTVAASKKLGRIDHPAFDITSVFEALVNAVAHRDYSVTGSKIRLRLFSDRLEICSPGTIPNSMTLDSMSVRQAARNETLTSLLAKCPIPDDVDWLETDRRTMMDRRGEGVSIILKRSEDLSGRQPLYQIFDEAELQLILFANTTNFS